MKFVPLSRVILLELKRNGYNILTSKNTVDDENPTWYPLTVPDVDDYLLQLDCSGSIVPEEGQVLLVIEDALDNIHEGQLQGEVFIEIDNLGELEDKIQFYGKKYQFISDPEYYVFSFDPKRVLIRNYALRTGNHLLYLAYIGVNYPTHVIDEIRDLEDLTRSLICLDQEQAREWFRKHDVTMVQSDISIFEKDAILTIFLLGTEQQIKIPLEDKDELIYNLMHIEDLLQLRDLFWIDPRIN
ncbi:MULTISPECIES: hypothetical protein [unclassified Sphingobacterium]|uniref:hypothetical protein n=1 Tax=unclassified Sphingobacterium TaxID=2609468 RepID=UPI00038A0C2B|nr:MULTISPECIES: hypothetical protein [unclassified Sphingobacterium]KKX47785.1 hypothetical protein L950_0224630 [Sphingobacterium sp. IITKGP-BTPF85]NJI72676.1 hypothetical protein [Sphingobacterium sp. B16(2022)]